MTTRDKAREIAEPLELLIERLEVAVKFGAEARLDVDSCQALLEILNLVKGLKLYGPAIYRLATEQPR